MTKIINYNSKYHYKSIEITISMISSNFFHIIHEGVAAYARSPQGEHIAAQGETSPTQKLIFGI